MPDEVIDLTQTVRPPERSPYLEAVAAEWVEIPRFVVLPAALVGEPEAANYTAAVLDNQQFTGRKS